MIPFIRSITELMLITESRDRLNKEFHFNNITEDSGQRKRYIISNDNKIIDLPNIHNPTRRKWKRSKEAIRNFFDALDYNNQIQSSYDLTLLERLNKYDNKDAA